MSANVSANAGTGDNGTSTDTGCTGDGTDQSSDTISTFGGSSYSGSTSGQTTGQQGSQTAGQQGSQSSGTGSASFSLDPRSFRRDTNTEPDAGSPPEEAACGTGGTRLLTPRTASAGGTRDIKGDAATPDAGAEPATAGDTRQAAAEVAPETSCGRGGNRPPDPANARPAPLRERM